MCKNNTEIIHIRFVSDVTPPDFADLFTCLLSPSFFSTSESDRSSPETRSNLEIMVNRWKSYLACGVFALSVPEETPLGANNVMADFWTEPWPYWDIKERSSELFESLREGGLVIFKVRNDMVCFTLLINKSPN